ncbi:MAG TPA: cohesin domain-containing protein [Longimicrobiaceae bacterium]|nr:cohesin domain-containing protein [Longimicrobiaceae bacterium]
MSRIKRFAAPLALALGLGLLAGCENAVQPQEPNVLEGLAPGIHPIVVLASKSGSSAAVELHLKRVGVEAKIASFQGELGYDADRLTLAGAELSPGVMGAWHESAPGTVRFAGAAMDGVGDGAVLRLRFTAKGAVEAGAFRVRVEELVSSADFQDLAPRVVVREQPVFSPVPLR